MKTIADLVGKNIRMRRVALGLSQTALAKSAKISNITLNRIENGKQAPQGASLSMIAEVLKCSEAELYNSNEPSPETAPDILEAIERGVAQVTGRQQVATSEALSPEHQHLIALISKLSDTRVRTLIQVIEADPSAILSDEDENPRRRRR